MSNPTYLRKERKNDLFIESTMTYFSFFVPITLVVVFFFNRIFYCLFDYEISKYLRPYCFWWVLFEIMIQNNVEYFSFLGFRSFDTSFSANFPSKFFILLGILMMFFVLIGSAASYFIYYSEYGKLARYFLVNLLRFPSSYALMVIMYGFRPFLKGAIHAVLYDNWVLQMWMLTGVEFVIILLIVFYEFNYESHKSKPLFMMDLSYYVSLMLLNVLILCKYEYFKDEMVMKELLEVVITVMVYWMMLLILLKLVW